MMRGLLDYAPAALAEIAKVSKIGNDQHNPGEEMHHARGKSSDHADCAIRHLIDRGLIDDDGLRHSAKAAWRAIMNLQQELEDAGLAPLPRAARLPEPEPEPEPEQLELFPPSVPDSLPWTPVTPWTPVPPVTQPWYPQLTIPSLPDPWWSWWRSPSPYPISW